MPGTGGALVVSNHSGGMLTPDVLIFAPEFYGHFGFDRPLYTLGHQAIFMGPVGDFLHRAGVIEASRENAGRALRAGAVVLVFPGGDYDSYRPTMTANTVDFAGRTGYVRTALDSGCRSCRWCRSAPRRRRCFWRVATRSRAGSD